MNNVQQINHPLEEWTMHQLLDFKGSFQKSKQLLNEYCSRWRAERKKENPNAGKHGGVTANHRDLVRALLRILPKSMEWIRQERQSIFSKCVKNNIFALVTNSVTLRKQMAERKEGDETEETDMISRSTLFEALRVLEAAGIIFARKAVNSPEQDEDKKAILIYLHPDALSLYSPSKAIEDLPEAVSDTLNENFETEEPLAPSPIVRISDYYNTNIQSTKNYNNNEAFVENVSAAADQSHEAEKVRSTESKTRPNKIPRAAIPGGGTAAEILWKSVQNMLYDAKEFDLSTTAQCIQMIEAHFEAHIEYIEQLRKEAIAAFCRSDKYLAKPEKARPAYLKWFVDKQLPAQLRNPERTAMAMILDAIRMQAEASQKYNFKTYWPTVFLSEDYGLQKYLKMIRNDIQKEISTPIAKKCTAIRIRTTLRGYLSAFAAVLAKSGISYAVSQVDAYVGKAGDLLKAEEMERDQKIHFYNYFKMQILSMIQN